MTKRAEDVEQTRQRIVEAAVHLHSTLGPARTSISAIAEHAGVTRLTYYRHFPDDQALFAACSAHWMSTQHPPRPQDWAEIADPSERLRAGLTDIYRFYGEAASMLDLAARDIGTVPEPTRQAWLAHDRLRLDALLGTDVAATQDTDRLRRAVIGHAAAYATWRSLCREQGLTPAEAVDAMVQLVAAVADQRRVTQI